MLASSSVASEAFQVEEASIGNIQKTLQDMKVSRRQIVHSYLDRIAACDCKGPAG